MVAWSDTALLVVVPNTHALGQTVSVVVTTSAGTSNSADFLTDSTAAPFNVLPQNLSLLVGQTRTVSVTDSNGNALTGLEWSTSNASVVSLSSDDPPVLTAVAPGTAVVYVVGMPILVTVYAGTALPAGTPIWSVPTTGGGIFKQVLVPAVPSASGADVLVLDDVSVRALASDGTPLWSTPVTRDSYSRIIPDFSGSALVTQPYSFTDANGFHTTHTLGRIDPNTHQLTTLYTFATSINDRLSSNWSDVGATDVVVPHPSGVVFVQDVPTFATSYDPNSINATVSVIDPSQAQTLASIPLEISTSDDTCEGPGCSFDEREGYEAPSTGLMIVAGDGNAYLPYTYTVTTQNWVFNSSGIETNDTVQRDTHFMLLRVATDGSYAKTELGSWSNTSDSDTSACSGVLGTVLNPYVITNGSTGVAVFSYISTSPCGGTPTGGIQLYLASQGGSASPVSVAVPASVVDLVPTLQREDGSYIAFDRNSNLYALGLDGSVQWQQLLPTPPNSVTDYGDYSVTPIYATADGGVIATSTFQCSANLAPPPAVPSPGNCAPWSTSGGGTLYTLDQNGNVTSQTPDSGATMAWGGDWYASVGAVIDKTAPSQLDLDWSWGAVANGNPSATGISVFSLGDVEEKHSWLIRGLQKIGLVDTCPGSATSDNPVPLSGNALNLYSSLKSQLVGWLQHLPPGSTCANFMRSRPTFKGGTSLDLNQLISIINNQIPVDGLKSTTSEFIGGYYADWELNVLHYQQGLENAPLCGVLRGANATAVSAFSAAATGSPDYIFISTKGLTYLTQATILHEALHHLTGLVDFAVPENRPKYSIPPPYDLKTFVGIETTPGVDPHPSESYDISQQLEKQGCVAPQ